MNKTLTILTDLNISKDDEQVRVGLYTNIGYFIQMSQMLEYNLRILLCYAKSLEEIESGEITTSRVDEIHKKYDDYYLSTYKDKFVLGRLKDEVAKLNLFEPDVIAIFKAINDYRTQVVHKIFQNNNNSKVFEQSDNVLEYIMKRLVPMAESATTANEFVVKCIEAHREDFREYKMLDFRS
jgi:hypothetical protein